MATAAAVAAATASSVRGPVGEIYEFRLGLSSGGDTQVNTFGEPHTA